MDATLSTAALASVEAAINKALEYDPASRLALGKLSGQVMVVRLIAPAVTVYLSPSHDGLRLLGHWEGDTKVQVRGTLPALARLAISNQSNLRASGAEVEGDTGMLLELRTIMHGLDIDWEEALSQLLGDVAGHSSAQLLRNAGHWFRGRVDSGQRLMSEFITEELRLLPSRIELENFYRSVDQLRLDLDRAEARLQQLKVQRQSQSPGASPDAKHKD